MSPWRHASLLPLGPHEIRRLEDRSRCSRKVCCCCYVVAVLLLLRVVVVVVVATFQDSVWVFFWFQERVSSTWKYAGAFRTR